jgi:hypothetical protein
MEKKINKGLVFCVMVFLMLITHGCKSKAFKTLAGFYAIEKIESVPSGREISLGGISFNSLDLGKNNDCSIPTFGWNSCENCKWGVKKDSTITIDCSKSELAGVYGQNIHVRYCVAASVQPSLGKCHLTRLVLLFRTTSPHITQKISPKKENGLPCARFSRLALPHYPHQSCKYLITDQLTNNEKGAPLSILCQTAPIFRYCSGVKFY